ncbi:hypothetical protein GCM10010530_00100 [Kribbella aluminosa]
MTDSLAERIVSCDRDTNVAAKLSTRNPTSAVNPNPVLTTKRLISNGLLPDSGQVTAGVSLWMFAMR